jgi:hypothetical protein
MNKVVEERIYIVYDLNRAEFLEERYFNKEELIKALEDLLGGGEIDDDAFEVYELKEISVYVEETKSYKVSLGN